MRFRRPHTKSRQGCDACKARHIKCDEQGPPCVNCLVRESPCVYPPKHQSPKKHASPGTSACAGRPRKNTVHLEYGEMVWALNGAQTPEPATPAASALAATAVRATPSSSSTTPALVKSTSIERKSSSKGVPTPGTRTASSLSPLMLSPLAFASTPPGPNKTRELELMHRWSTRSWKMLYAVPECAVNVRTNLTRASLGYTFMTKAVLAAAALDTYIYGGGVEQNPQIYLRAALEYINDASADCRRQLTSITKDNIWLLSNFSSMLGIFHFALPLSFGGRPDAGTSSMLARTTTLFGMTIAAVNISAINWTWSLESPSSSRTILEKYPTDFSLLAALRPDVEAAIKRMSRLARLVRLPPTGDGTEGPYASTIPSYRNAINQTRYCFAEGRIRGYCLSVAAAANAAGPEFFAGLQAREPIALFVIMFWGVLLNVQAYDDVIWWISGSGRDLIGEVSEALATTSLIEFEDCREGVAWARAQVGLAPLPAASGLSGP